MGLCGRHLRTWDYKAPIGQDGNKARAVEKGRDARTVEKKK